VIPDGTKRGLDAHAALLELGEPRFRFHLVAECFGLEVLLHAIEVALVGALERERLL